MQLTSTAAHLAINVFHFLSSFSPINSPDASHLPGESWTMSASGWWRAGDSSLSSSWRLVMPVLMRGALFVSLSRANCRFKASSLL